MDKSIQYLSKEQLEEILSMENVKKEVFADLDVLAKYLKEENPTIKSDYWIVAEIFTTVISKDEGQTFVDTNVMLYADNGYDITKGILVKDFFTVNAILGVVYRK